MLVNILHACNKNVEQNCIPT